MPASFYPGDKATWRHVARGGYGYVTLVNVEVVKATASRVTIRVRKATGETVTRTVRPESLKPTNWKPEDIGSWSE